MRNAGKGRVNSQYSRFRPGTYIIVTLVGEKIICTNWKHRGSEHRLCLDSVNCSSTAHLLPVQLKVVIINKMKNEPVREQFSHCAEVRARYPPQALGGRDVVKGTLWFRSSNRKTLHKPSNSFQPCSENFRCHPRAQERGKREAGWQHDALLHGCGRGWVLLCRAFRKTACASE